MLPSLQFRTMPEDEADSPRARGSLESKASQVKLGLMSNIRGLQSQSNHWLGKATTIGIFEVQRTEFDKVL